MALQPDDFDFLSNFSTLGAIVIGAVLATVGGLAGSQIERVVERRQRERDAALLFAEVFSTLKILLDMAGDTHKVGDPYGPITMRFLRAARRELEIYDRNREQLYSLGSADLRARVHRDAVRLTMPLDGVFDATREIETVEAQLRAPNLPDADRAELGRRLAAIRESRDTSFEFIVETAAEMKPVIDSLRPLAGQTSGRIEDAVRAVRPVSPAGSTPQSTGSSV